MSSNESRRELNESTPRRKLRVEVTASTMITALLVVGAAWMLIQLSAVLLTLIGALMLVGTVNPAVQWLEAHRIRRAFGIAIVFSVLLLIILLLVMLTIPALVAQVSNLIDQEANLRARLADFLADYRVTAAFADALRNFHYEALLQSAGPEVLAASTRLLKIVAYSAGAVFLALYIMIDRDRLRGALFAAVPRSQHVRLSRVLLNLQIIVGGYIRGQAVTCVLMGIFVFILLTACGIPNALAFAVFAGLVDILPFIGIFLTIGPILVAALMKGPIVTAIVLVLMLCYEEFESRVLVPIVYGRALRLPSAVVLFALLAGGTLAGITGALLALPVAAAMLMLIEELRVEMPGQDSQADSVQRMKDEQGEAEYERRTEGMSAEQAAPVAVEISESRKQDEKQAKPAN